MNRALFFTLVFFAAVVPATAQDIRGLEVCTAERTMERRTSCLQSNVEYLQQALARQKRETQSRLDAASREAAAQKAELAALKSAIAKLQHELTELKKEKPAKK
jgi:septal ring factor EnvC (AmiA/AmiB activator)